MAADIRIPVLFALVVLCMPLPLAGAPKATSAPTARQVVEGLVRAQREAPAFTQAYRGIKTVDGCVEKDKELRFEIHRSGGGEPRYGSREPQGLASPSSWLPTRTRGVPSSTGRWPI